VIKPIAVIGAAAVFFGGAAFAQDQVEQPAVSGVVQSYDANSREVIFEDGTRYTLGENSTVDSLENGSEVSLSCDLSNANCAVVTGPDADQGSHGHGSKDSDSD
jgi:hypothetical protein